MGRTSCCKNCSDRTAVCHSTCERYLAESKARRKEKELRMKKSIMDTYLRGRACNSKSRSAKKTIITNRYLKKGGGI